MSVLYDDDGREAGGGWLGLCEYGALSSLQTRRGLRLTVSMRTSSVGQTCNNNKELRTIRKLFFSSKFAS